MEWESKKRWENEGYTVARSAGSHGVWDICAVKAGQPTNLIQCKLTENESVAKALAKSFRESPPLVPDRFYHQVLEIKVKGNTNIRTVVV